MADLICRTPNDLLQLHCAIEVSEGQTSRWCRRRRAQQRSGMQRWGRRGDVAALQACSRSRSPAFVWVASLQLHLLLAPSSTSSASRPSPRALLALLSLRSARHPRSLTAHHCESSSFCRTLLPSPDAERQCNSGRSGGGATTRNAHGQQHGPKRRHADRSARTIATAATALLHRHFSRRSGPRATSIRCSPTGCVRRCGGGALHIKRNSQAR